MTRHLGGAVFLLGLAAIGWVAYGYLGANPLALTMTALIAAAYLAGALELRRFQQATRSLGDALAGLPEQLAVLDDWLAKLHPSLRTAVRLRIEGERVALPGPSMAPYLVGLLVLLGMLGTFLGMVVTLNGTVLALEQTSDLATMRSALAAPVKGLGLAFGTSVAGVAASAMLGMLLTLRRRERQQLAQQLDARIATSLQPFSLAHQRRQTLQTLQLQSQALPELVATMQAAMLQMDKHHSVLSTQLLDGQQQFFSRTENAFSELAASVDRSLQQSLAEAGRAAGNVIQPLAEATMTTIARESSAFQQKIAGQVERQLDGLATRFDATVGGVSEALSDSLARQQRGSEAMLDGLQQTLAAFSRESGLSLERQSTTLLATVEQSHTTLQAELAAADRKRLEQWTVSLDAMRQSLQHEWQQVGQATLAQQQQICRTLEQTAAAIQQQAELRSRETINEVSRLVETAAQAPQAAAELVAELRDKLSASLSRDNEMLAERSRIITSLTSLLDAVDHAATQQRGAIDTLVESSAAMLQQAGAQFGERIDAESAKIETVSAQLSASTVEAASVGESFGLAVKLFGDASESMIGQLQRIEGALGKSTARSDEQLGYFVAQAREIIDLSISSQQHIIDQLRELSAQREPA
ncbi:DUF802 domain-containing protein [Piscinibacter sakaiensis]|uniref:DUF802 domain-containing protein n=1 Tax=Piscinibacter sakaiensis TaxID=1547922 RepID=UPI003AADF594